MKETKTEAERLINQCRQKERCGGRERVGKTVKERETEREGGRHGDTRVGKRKGIIESDRERNKK